MNRYRRVESVGTMSKPRGSRYFGTSSEETCVTVRAASGIKAAGTWSRLLCGTWERVTLVLREPRKRRPRKRLSTDTAYTGGAARMSEEGSVTGLEQRGCPVRCRMLEQPLRGGLR